MPTLQQVCSVIPLQIIHLQLHVKLSFHLKKSIVVFGNRHISVGNAQKQIQFLTNHSPLLCHINKKVVAHHININSCYGFWQPQVQCFL